MADDLSIFTKLSIVISVNKKNVFTILTGILTNGRVAFIDFPVQFFVFYSLQDPQYVYLIYTSM